MIKHLLPIIIMLLATACTGQYRHKYHKIDTVTSYLDTIQGQIVYVKDSEVKIGFGIKIQTRYQFYDIDLNPPSQWPFTYELATGRWKPVGDMVMEYEWKEGGTPLATKNVIHFIPN